MRMGKETIQLYIRDNVGSVTRPVKELKAFQQVNLQPDEEKIISFQLSANDLGFFNENREWIIEPGDFTVYVGGNSRDVLEVNFRLVE